MIKVAINRCHGGFGLSPLAMQKLLDRKGIEYWTETEESSWLGVSYYRKGMTKEDDHGYISEYELCEDRSDPDLIAVIEELGEEANGWAAELAIVEIPDDVNGNWYIHDYDGMEWVAERHRTWS